MPSSLLLLSWDVNKFNYYFTRICCLRLIKTKSKTQEMIDRLKKKKSIVEFYGDEVHCVIHTRKKKYYFLFWFLKKKNKSKCILEIEVSPFIIECFFQYIIMIITFSFDRAYFFVCCYAIKIKEWIERKEIPKKSKQKKRRKMGFAMMLWSQI